MSSKTWTIVCLTLTLLIFGCSDSEVAKVAAPNQPGTVGVAASLTSGTIAGLDHVPVLPPDAGSNEPLEIPRGFQPPEVSIPGGDPRSFGGSEILVPVVRTHSDESTDAVQLLGFVDAIGLKALLSETNTLKVVRLEDEATDVQVIAVQAPTITVRRGDVLSELNLFELPGFRHPKSVFDVTGKTFGGKALRGLNTADVPVLPFGGPGTNGEPELPPIPEFPATVMTPFAFQGLDNGGNAIAPQAGFELNRNGERLGLHSELPGLEGGPEVELPD